MATIIQFPKSPAPDDDLLELAYLARNMDAAHRTALLKIARQVYILSVPSPPSQPAAAGAGAGT